MRQLLLSLGAMAMGVAVGLSFPTLAPALELAITPVLGVLLYATFLGVPFAHLRRAVRQWRFLAAILSVNFVAAPVIVFTLSRFIADDSALLIGVLLVLLTPCVDYVIVFARLAGGATERLLAATPLLMLLQIVLLPGYLWLMAGPDVVGVIDARPFVEAFLFLIMLPLGLAALTQLLARRRPIVRRVETAAATAMVPLMMLTLFVVVASQAFHVSGSARSLLLVVPIFVAFVPIVACLGAVIARAFGLDTPARRAVVFSGVTRNSLVVLPLALALPAPWALAPLVVVTQTLVELIAMVTMVALVPRLVPFGGRTRSTASFG